MYVCMYVFMYVRVRVRVRVCVYFENTLTTHQENTEETNV